MNEAEQLDLIRVLKKTFYATKKQDIKALRSLSDHIIDDASVFQDNYSISLAIILYTLSKIFEKEKYQLYPEWNSFYNKIISNIKKLIFYLEKSDFDNYSASLKELLSSIKKLDKKASLYIEEVVKSSKIKKGSNLYSYGLSLGRTAELLGISKWELMNYIGNIELKTQGLKTVSVKQRYNMAEKIFNLR